MSAATRRRDAWVERSEHAGSVFTVECWATGHVLVWEVGDSCMHSKRTRGAFGALVCMGHVEGAALRQRGPNWVAFGALPGVEAAAVLGVSRARARAEAGVPA